MFWWFFFSSILGTGQPYQKQPFRKSNKVLGGAALLVAMPAGIVLYLAIMHWVIALCVLPFVVAVALAAYAMARPDSRVATWFGSKSAKFDAKKQAKKVSESPNDVTIVMGK